MSARVKVLHVFKGSAPQEIVLRFRMPQPNLMLVDSPIHMGLAQGARYRFFLKPAAKKDEFVDVLDGKIDDGFALQSLCEDEADNNPYMSNKEAIRLALDYLHKKEPAISYDPKLVSAFPEPGGSAVEVMVATSNNSGARQATVAVFRDRTIDEQGSQLDQRR
jgi:hypothetical protein